MQDMAQLQYEALYSRLEQIWKDLWNHTRKLLMVEAIVPTADNYFIRTIQSELS